MKITSILQIPPRQNLVYTIKADDLNFIQENIIGVSNNEIDSFVSSVAENVVEDTTDGISDFVEWVQNLFD